MLKLEEKIRDKSAKIGIVGLGYVGLPLAVAFAKSLKVIGFDTDAEKVHWLQNRQSVSPRSAGDPLGQDSRLTTIG